MATLLPPRYYGSIFHIEYTKDEKGEKNLEPAILITGKDSFMVLTKDWSKPVVQISTNNVQEMKRGKHGVHCKYKADNKIQHIYFKSEKTDKLYSAITVETSNTAQMPNYNTLPKVIPTFKFEMDSVTEELYQNLINLQTRFYSSFNCAKPSQIPFVDLLVCVYRFRYLNDSADQIQNNVDALLTEIRRQFFSDWCLALLKAAQFDPKVPNAYDFSLRIVTSLLTDIHLNSDSIEANTTDLYKAVGEMCERGDATNITAAVKSMLDIFDTMYEDGYKAQPCANQAILRVLTRVLLLMFCGNMLQIYPIEIERLVIRTAEFTVAAYNKNLLEEHFKILRKTVDSFHNELLRFMDTRRYDPLFRFVYVSAELSEKIKNTKL
ncbi:hypothetical protein TVAG_163590 [Trichomonas vaginalis G3]|uniref:Uncharacterized protein n=1 Tax=Trichomonas vaginalis (strain ATCC PRA-98 / G3) TaxID=412133 RepID=A2DG36_TRIV3|nr:hypothetical protein TVAGG3_0953610 [Trichomonas vaginalis G3]EAY20663.1 hypothetical protein TVAG_163590 [Trichomonas vaginalis G3]KAI5487384.1 hypothetical protein TVAGG3_0953610 [Trichomonas vaginalis G3]|eukprot:XP_001581649.1 hypothetical protein [Trichomonas vaginalis G3]